MERLDKWIAAQGAWTRSEARALLRRGAVKVDGAVERSADRKIDPEGSEIEVEGRRLSGERHSYLMLHKPAGVVSASRDERGQTVVDLLPPDLWRKGLFPAGRLDKDTEGFVLLTDDGAFAHRILAPRSHVAKTYEAVVSGPVTEADIRAFAEGLQIGPDLCRSAGLRVLRAGAQPRVEVVLTEGMYHQIKRMFAALGKEVLYLKRTRIGPVALDPALPKGGARPLTAEERAMLGAGDEGGQTSAGSIK